MKEKQIRRIINRIIFCIALIVFVVSAVQLIQIYKDYHTSDSEYSNLQDNVHWMEAEDDSNEADTQTEPTEVMLYVDFATLQKENPDCIAWIHFPNLDISYPVMQGKDNDEYLRHTFYKEYATAGSIFIDAKNAADFTDWNTFVYGHNMKDGSMFGQLRHYEEEDFYKENPGFYISTPEGCSYYQIYSCHLAPVEGQEESYAISFTDEEEYKAFQEKVKEKSFYDTGVLPDAEQRTVTLMTCNQAGYDYRLLVHGVQKVTE